MKKLMMVLVAAMAAVVSQMLAAGMALADVSLSVTSYDASVDKVTLTFSELEENMYLFAVRDTSDKGTADIAQWQAVKFLKKLYKGAKSCEAYLPREIAGENGTVRFLLSRYHTEKPVSCLHGTGIQWIDTLYKPDAQTTIEVVVKVGKRTASATSSYQATFGLSGDFYLFDGANMTYYGFYSATPSGGSFASYNTDNAIHTLKLGPEGVFIDNNQKVAAFESPTGASTRTMTLFGRRDKDTGAVSSITDDSYIYSAKISKGSETVRSFIPCVVDGEAMMWDKIYDRFYQNSGSGDFVPGEIAYPEDFTVSWSGPQSIQPEIRTISAVETVPGSGEVSLTFSAGTQQKALYVAYCEGGTPSALADWSDVRCVANIAPQTTSLSYTLPESFRSKTGLVKFFLVHWDFEKDIPCDCRVEYLNAMGAQWIDTEIKPDYTTTTKLKCRIISNTAENPSRNPFFGVSSQYYMFDNGQSTYYGFYSAASSFGRYNTDNSVHTLQLGPGGAFIDEIDQGVDFSGVTTGASALTMPIFARRNKDNGIVDTLTMYSYVYAADIFKGVEHVRSFVPCVIGGKPAMYDRVSGRPFYNEGSGDDFNVGNIVPNEVPAAYETASEAIGVKVPTITCSLNPSTQQVTVSLRGDAATSDGRVFLALATEDKGDVPSAWPNVFYLGRVPVNSTTFTAAMPEGWRKLGKSARIFYCNGNVPYDYTVEYLRGKGTQWIDTEIVPNMGTTTKMKCKSIRVAADASTMNPLFGVSLKYYMFDNGAATYWGMCTGQAGNFGRYNTDNGIHLLEFGPAGAFVDGVDQGARFWGWNASASYSMPIFGRKDNGTGVVDKIIKNGSIYGCEIVTNGVMARSYVPCVSSGKAAMYDRVSGRPFYNAAQSGDDFEIGTMLLDNEVLTNCAKSFKMGLILTVY